MFPAVEGNRRCDSIEDDKREDLPGDKSVRGSPDVANSSSTAKL